MSSHDPTEGETDEDASGRPAGPAMKGVVRKGWLTPSEMRRLGRELGALLPLGPTYHVGSSVSVEPGRTPRDIDLRLMLDDDVHAALTPEQWRILGDHIGRSLEVSTGVARIDFQIQSVTEANRDHPGGLRSALFVLERLDRREQQEEG